MPLEIRQLPRMRLAYMRQTGPYGPSLTQLWERFGRWCEANRLSEPRPKYYGISLDNPACTPPAQCRYDACVEVDDRYVPSGAALVTKLPGGRYASMPFHGTAGDIKAAWTRLLRDWLPGSRLQLDSRPCVELYRVDARYDAATGAFECQLCIPVAPL